jgi:hypothetical protein
MLAILDRARHDTEDIRGLNWSVVRHMADLVIKLPLQSELPFVWHTLLYETGLKEA